MTAPNDEGGGKGPQNENQSGSHGNVIVKKESAAAAATRNGEDDNEEALLKAEDMINGGDCDNNVIRNGSSSDVLPKPMEGLNESDLPPFLTKMFEMVEDPETDPIVSWSINRNSLIVWDTQKFCENLLPKYFKHCHFSSFIRQLNTYGFRKIAWDKWEFANEAFQGGKKHLLKNIKRNRNRKSKYNSTSTNNIELESEIGNLKKHQSELQIEVKKLTRKMEESNDQLNIFKDRLQFVECRQRQIFNFLSKLQQKKELDEGNFTSKKRKLLETQVTKCSPEPTGADQSVTKSLPEHKGTGLTDQSDTNNFPELMGIDQNATNFENQVDQEQLEPMQFDEFPKFFLGIEKEFWDDQLNTKIPLGESSRIENATTNEELSLSVNDYKIDLVFEPRGRDQL